VRQRAEALHNIRCKSLAPCFFSGITHHGSQASTGSDMWTTAWSAWPLKTRRTGCPETSVRNCQHTLHNNTEERRPHLHRGGSLKTCMWTTRCVNSVMTRCSVQERQ